MYDVGLPSHKFGKGRLNSCLEIHTCMRMMFEAEHELARHDIACEVTAEIIMINNSSARTRLAVAFALWCQRTISQPIESLPTVLQTRL